MTKYILFCTLFMLSAVAFADITHPKFLPSGAKFLHFSCKPLSNNKINSIAMLNSQNIKIQELGFNLFNEGALSASYGGTHKCEYLLSFKMQSNTNILTYISSEATNKSACMAGHIILESLFSAGFKFRQSAKDHTRFSLELPYVNHRECSGTLNLEFKRTR